MRSVGASYQYEVHWHCVQTHADARPQTWAKRRCRFFLPSLATGLTSRRVGDAGRRDVARQTAEGAANRAAPQGAWVFRAQRPRRIVDTSPGCAPCASIPNSWEPLQANIVPLIGWRRFRW